MSKPNLIVSTCGTSRLANRAEASLRKLLLDYANTIQLDEVPDEMCQRIAKHLQSRQQECADFASCGDLRGCIRTNLLIEKSL